MKNDFQNSASCRSSFSLRIHGDSSCYVFTKLATSTKHPHICPDRKKTKSQTWAVVQRKQSHTSVFNSLGLRRQQTEIHPPGVGNTGPEDSMPPQQSFKSCSCDTPEALQACGIWFTSNWSHADLKPAHLQHVLHNKSSAISSAHRAGHQPLLSNPEKASSTVTEDRCNH